MQAVATMPARTIYLLPLLTLLVFIIFNRCETRLTYSCSSTTTACGSSAYGPENRTSIYVLVMVPFPDDREGAGWDYGMQMLPGGRIVRDFINCNRSDLLPGYRLQVIETNHEACGITDAVEEVYINLARFGLGQECGPVIAVAGLACSPSTVRVSGLAGRAEVDLIQLSTSGSPIFDRDVYPRLWRYVSTASVYADTVIELMKALDWGNVGLIQDLGSEYYFNIGEYFKEAVAQNNFTLQLLIGIESINTRLLDTAIQMVKDSKVKIIFASTTFAQSTLLICRAAAEGLITPRYLWIFPDMYIADFEEQISSVGCDLPTLYRGLNGTLLLQYNLANAVDVVHITGGEFHNYNDLYMKYFEDVLKDFDYSGNIVTPVGVTYSHLLFDQIWSLVHALNLSLPLLQSKNITIGTNTVGNAKFADALEERLSNLHLLGITGHIYFSKKVYSTPIRIVYPTVRNETSIINTTVGILHNGSLQWFNLTASDVPNDIETPTLVALHIAVKVLMYLTISVVTLLTTTVLSLFLFYWNKPEVKAASPYLSMFMFAGCYLLCLAALLRITYGGFGGVSIFGTLFEVMCGLELFVDQNGYTLIFVTIFIKLLRVHNIFNNKQLRNLSSLWKNRSLAVIVVALCIIPNVLSAIIIGKETPNYNSSVISLPEIRDENGVLIELVIVSCNLQNQLFYIISYLPLVFYFVSITYLAVTMRRIKHRNFKDTKKVNIFLVITFLLTVAYLFAWWLLLVKHQKHYVVMVQTLFPLIVAMACQMILLAPKVVPSCWRQFKNITDVTRYIPNKENSTKTSTASNSMVPKATNFTLSSNY